MPQFIQQSVPEAKLVGEGKFTYFFWDVYTAQLYAPQGKWLGEPPYALTLTYLRDFKGADIAKRSVDEMRKQGFNDKEKLTEWEAVMSDLFPDVEEGTRLTGLLRSSGETVFLRDETEIGTVEDARFGQQFFAIWLSEKTSEPKLREKLVGVDE